MPMTPPTNGLEACPPRWATARNPDRLTYGGKVADIAEALGTPLMPWQRYVADVALEVDPTTGLLAYRTVVLTVPRQTGKTALLLAVWLHRAIAWPNQQIAWTMQSAKDAREKWEDSHVPTLEASRLWPLVKTVRRSNGSEAIIFKNGSIQRLMASTISSGHGKELDLGIVDEAFAQSDDRLEQAMRPAMRTRAQPQMWIVSTAGDPSSTWFHGWVDAGRAHAESDLPTSLAHFEWSAPDDADPGDPAVWRGCIPALGYTITQPVIADEYRAATATEDGLALFRRSSLNQRTSQRADPPIPLDLWDACQADADRPPDGLTWAVDVSPNQASAAIAVTWRRPDGVPQVQLVDYRPGVAWLAARVSHLRSTWGGTWLLDARGASGSQAAGWPGEIVTPANARRACVELEAAIHARQLGHFAQPELRAALEGAVKRPQDDGGWSWARQRTTVDICPLVAITLAHGGLLSPPNPPVKKRDPLMAVW
ncbi:MAG: terminase large subunit domain-containing protein [Acidimicrobiales bacterium]